MKKITFAFLCTIIFQFSFGQTSELGILTVNTGWPHDLGSSIRPQSPAITSDGSTIYIGSEDNTNFHAINSDGTEKWKYDELTDNVYASATIGPDGTIYVGSKDDRLHAITDTGTDGTQKWTANVNDFVIGSTPAISADGSTIYVGSDDNNLYAINTSGGGVKWTYATGADVRGTPAIASDGTIYVTSRDDMLYAITDNGTSGDAKWMTPVDLGGNAESGLAIQSDGTIIVGVDQGVPNGALFAVNPDGSVKWSKTFTGRITVCAPALAADGTIYVGTKEGNNLMAFNSDGDMLWDYEAGDIINSSPAVGDDGNIYFGSFDHFLYCIDSSGNLVDRIDLGERIWSSPAIYNNTLYVGTYGNLLYSINIPSTGLASSDWPMFGKNVQHTSNAASGSTLTVEDFDAQDGFKVFYNEGHLNIISKEFVRGSHAVIYNLMGQKIIEADLELSRTKTHKIPLEGSTGRIFFVNIFNDFNNSAFTKKVIVR